MIKGRCLCGAVTVTVGGAHEAEIGACHCRMCQRWSGGLFLCFDAETVSATGPVRVHASSSFSERAFCGECGSHLWMRDTDDDGASYDVMPGLFEAATRWPLRSEIYADRAMAAVTLSGDHRRQSAEDYELNHSHVDGDAS